MAPIAHVVRFQRHSTELIKVPHIFNNKKFEFKHRIAKQRTICGIDLDSHYAACNLEDKILCKSCAKCMHIGLHTDDDVFEVHIGIQPDTDNLVRKPTQYLRQRAYVGEYHITLFRDSLAGFTRFWIYQARCPKDHAASINDIVYAISLWIKSNYYKSVPLQDYLDGILETTPSI
jgi:hypothetical protein